MKMRVIILFCHLVFVLPLFASARASTDVIVMQNGDRLTGEAQSPKCRRALCESALCNPDPVGGSVKGGAARKQATFLVKTEDGNVYRGVLNSRETGIGRPIEIEIAEAPEKKAVINSARVVNVSETSEKFLQRFTGGVSFGTIYTKANQTTQYSISGLASYPREPLGGAGRPPFEPVFRQRHDDINP